MTARLARALALVAALAPAALAQPGAPAGVGVEYLRRTGGDRQVAWVSVVDAEGLPIASLPAGTLTVQHDGRPVDDLEFRGFREVFHAFDLTVVADPALLRPDGGAGLAALISAIAPGGAPGDRVILRAIGRGGAAEAPLDRAAERARDLAGAAPSGRLYDALYDAVRDAARAPASRGRAVLVVTDGADQGSRRGVVDVLAVAGLAARPVPIEVLVVDRGGASEVDRLERLVARTGGAVRRLGSAASLASEGEALVRRARSGVRLTYRVRDFDRSLEAHVLTLTVAGPAGPRTTRFEYAAADVSPAPWWTRPLALLVPGAILLLALALVLFGRRRRLCTVRVTRGDEIGCRYEIYGMPATIGAAVGNDMTFPEPAVSRNHAVLERRGSGIELLDLNSENGTFVNGERITRRQLVHGDRIGLGGVVEIVFEGKGTRGA